MPLSKDRPPNSVIVELVLDRSFKDDCRAGTGIVWRGKGDQNYYPANLWVKLAPHPDVWKLIEEEDRATPSSLTPAAALRLEEEAAAKLDAERAELRRLEEEQARIEAETRAEQEREAQRRADRERADMENAGKLTAADVAKVNEGEPLTADQAAAQSQEAAGQGTDKVTATIGDVEFADAFDYAALTPEAQAKLSIEEMRDLAVALDYGIHPRTGEEKTRLKFAEITAQRIAQKDEIVDTTGVDDGVVPIPPKKEK